SARRRRPLPQAQRAISEGARGDLPTSVRRGHGADSAAYQETDPRSRRGPEYPAQTRVAMSRSLVSRGLTLALIAGSLWAFGYERRTVLPQARPAAGGESLESPAALPDTEVGSPDSVV